MGFVRVAVVAMLAVAAVSIYLAVGDPSSRSSEAVGFAGNLTAFAFATACSVRAARRPSPARPAWILMSVATGLSTLSVASYAVTLIGGAETTSTPVLDVFGLVAYAVPLLAAMVLFPRAPQRRISRYRTLLDALVITTGFLVISWATVLHDPYGSTADVGWTRLAYPIADVIICATAVTLGMRQHPADRPVWLSFGAGVVILAVTDSVYVALLSSGLDVEELTGSPLAGGWMAAGVLVGLSGLVPASRHPERPRDLAVLIQLVPYGPVLGAYLILFVRFASDDVPLLVGEVVLLVLVMARQVIMVYENVNLTQHLEETVTARTAELTLAQQEAQESSRLKSEFLATMSHEIRTPMNGVIGLTSLLLSTRLDDLQHQYAEGVRSAGEALLALINDILDFSKLDAGKVSLDPSDFDLPVLIEELGALLAPAAFTKQLELIACCQPGVPQIVHGDAGRIRQIVLNLASNAVKFTPEGEVVVSVSEVGREGAAGSEQVRLRFAVSDTGIGIAEGDRQRVFESFSQADSSTTRRFGGTGLGLAISQRLVEAMGGEIGVTSAAGVGSTFWFEIVLPVGVSSVVSAPPLDPDVLAGRRVLVVDDNATHRTVLKAQLSSWDIQPDLVGDAHASLRELRRMAAQGRPYDAAVLDLVMPEVDGLELARTISADPVLTGLPMIMLVSSTPVQPALLRSVGIHQWLSKPLRSSDLYDGLVRLLGPQNPHVVEPADGADPAAAAPPTRGRVLVVEDNPLNQLVAEGTLARMGYEVDSVGNGLEAVGAAGATRYAAILMDCHLPVLDGFAATREIRRRESEGARTPIIAMTAAALVRDRRRCLEAGMDDHVSKPIDAASLQSVLDRWVRRRSDSRAPGQPQVGQRPPVLDRRRLADLSELQTAEGSSLLTSVVRAFVDRSEDRLIVMRRTAAVGDLDELRAAAHELRGASGTIGARRVEALCRELELSGRPDGPGLREGLLDELGVELAHAAAQLADFAAAPSGSSSLRSRSPSPQLQALRSPNDS